LPIAEELSRIKASNSAIDGSSPPRGRASPEALTRDLTPRKPEAGRLGE
jgi:hypothetical protein